VWWRVAPALIVALALQVGTNYANDYSDGVRGTDHRRVGPVRLVGQGLASPQAVRRAAWMAFAVAGVAGLVLAAVAGWWLVAVGFASVIAGWAYTGGPRPYGYMGWGEVFVFVFFGLVATVGTAYVVIGAFPAVTTVCGVVAGLLACALLEANNVRDIDGDVEAGKRTLAVRLGRRRAGWAYVGLLLAAAAIVVGLAAAFDPWAALALLAVIPAVGPIRLAIGSAGGPSLIPMLVGTGRVQLVCGGLLTVGLLLGGAIR
jgi:1,4-dihydroxy-2-naphthoate octaprenyltransferase